MIDYELLMQALGYLEKETKSEHDFLMAFGSYVGKKKSLAAERDRLANFKTYVHKRLDAADIPTHPEGEHSKHGCRIGDRVDIALKPLPKGFDEFTAGFAYGVTREHVAPSDAWRQYRKDQDTQPEAECLAVGVGGVHSDSHGDDGGSCMWCGAQPETGKERDK